MLSLLISPASPCFPSTATLCPKTIRPSNAISLSNLHYIYGKCDSTVIQ